MGQDVEGVRMTIDVLQRAADAAGFAMAAPDDDESAPVISTPEPVQHAAPSTALSVVTQTRRAGGDAITAASGWIKSYLPAYLGGRATA